MSKRPLQYSTTNPLKKFWVTSKEGTIGSKDIGTLKVFKELKKDAEVTQVTFRFLHKVMRLRSRLLYMHGASCISLTHSPFGTNKRQCVKFYQIPCKNLHNLGLPCLVASAPTEPAHGTLAQPASSGTWPRTSATGKTTWTAASTASRGPAAEPSIDTTSFSRAIYTELLEALV
jgi:hypothetical protein